MDVKRDDGPRERVEAGPVAVFREPVPGSAPIELPYLLDFYPLQSEQHTRIHPFFDNLKQGRFTTTRCKSCGELLWQPRVVCSKCMSDDLEWVDLPKEGLVYAFTAMLRGAPTGMEADVPFVMGLVELKAPGKHLRLLSRIDGTSVVSLKIGQRVRLKIIDLPDGRVFYRFAPSPGKR